jgi:alanyl-tRNA synthetase
MLEAKKEFKRKAQREPEKYYPTEALREEGFMRRKCKSCGGYFWTPIERDFCGEPACSGGYTFIGDSPAGEKMDFIQTWKKFAELFSKLGYTPIPRYPVVARWRDDADFVQASIYDFQPYCVSGEVDPPANPLVVPQFCLRFNDIDNVGITGRHYTGFVMIGQHAFKPPEEYKPEDYLRHIYIWLVEGMKLPKEEIQFHEDAWAGGGNLGPSMEFFSRGLEIGNQVYMQYEVTDSGIKDLAIKVLDMGMGQERPAWFTHGTDTSYEAVFPTVAKWLYKKTGTKPREDLMRRFLPYSGMLDVEEKKVEDIWSTLAVDLGIDLEDLREEVIPLAGLYSVADHTRSLLLALSDGALPSNVGGGYNLRVLVRRSLDFIARYGWDISLPDACERHAKYLKPQYPELTEYLAEVGEILDVEKKKYEETRRKSRRIVARLRGEVVTVDRLIELYDSQGISPEMIVEEGIEVKVPEDFYIRVAEMHEKAEAVAKTKREREFDVSGLPATKILYYDDYGLVDFTSKVLMIMDGEYVVLDRTAFYPTSGGQLYDIGYMGGCRVVDVFKQGNVIIHRVKSPGFDVGDEVRCSIDWERRKQLAQHHTATHIVNGVARELLGNHIWQAGAEKTPEKARLDITHFASLTKEQLMELEKRANEVVKQDLVVDSLILRRDKAEAEYGFRLYQGGAVPGKEIRVVRIGDLDIEACGGTHLHRTSEVELIKLRGSTKIQDGIVRLEYYAGGAARRFVEEGEEMEEALRELATEILAGITGDEGPVVEMDEWIIDEKGIRESAEKLSVPIDKLEGTFERFFREIKEDSEEIERLRTELGKAPYELPEIPEDIRDISVFSDFLVSFWKDQRKELDKLRLEIAKVKAKALAAFEIIGGREVLVAEVAGGMEEVVKIAGDVVDKNRLIVLFGVDEKVSVVGMRGEDVDIDVSELVREASEVLGGGGGGRPDFAQGAGRNRDKLDEAMRVVRAYIKEKLV